MKRPSDTDTPDATETSRQARHSKRIAGLKHAPKLSWAQINEIRRTYVFRSSTFGTSGLARKYDVSANTIHKIVCGKTWKVQRDDGNVLPPLQHRITGSAFSNALAKLGNSREALEAQYSKITPSRR